MGELLIAAGAIAAGIVVADFRRRRYWRRKGFPNSRTRFVMRKIYVQTRIRGRILGLAVRNRADWRN
jgi:hypothetical protein